MKNLSNQLTEKFRDEHDKNVPSHKEVHSDPSKMHEFDQNRFPLLLNLADQSILDASTRSALDIGIGLGILTSRMKSSGISVTSLDLNREYLILARQRDKQINLVQGDCANLPFADSSFDMVIATDIIEHVEQYEQAIRECGRIARKRFLFSTSLNGLHRKIAEFLGYDVKGWDLSIGHLHVYSYKKLMKFFSSNLYGFRISRPTCLFVTPFYLSILTLNYRFPANWTRPILFIPNWFAKHFPDVFGNWIALTAEKQQSKF